MLQEKLQFSRIIQGVMNWGAWGAKMSTQQMAEKIEPVLDLGITTFDHADFMVVILLKLNLEKHLRKVV